MDRYILILTDTFEEVEALTQVDYLRRADIKVDMISTHHVAWSHPRFFLA